MKNWCCDWIWIVIRMKKWLLEPDLWEIKAFCYPSKLSQSIKWKKAVPDLLECFHYEENFLPGDFFCSLREISCPKVHIEECFKDCVSEQTWMKSLLERQLSCCLTQTEPQPRWVGAGLRRVPGQDCLELRLTWVRLHRWCAFSLIFVSPFNHWRLSFFISCHLVLSFC